MEGCLKTIEDLIYSTEFFVDVIDFLTISLHFVLIDYLLQFLGIVGIIRLILGSV